jgi:hypothetical protein
MLPQLVAGIIPFGFQMASPVLGPTESELDMAYMESRSVSRSTPLFSFRVVVFSRILSDVNIRRRKA